MKDPKENLVPFKKGDDPRRNLQGRPVGRKSLSTMVRDLLENEIDWKQVPLKNTDEFRAMYGEKPLAGEVLVRGAMAEAMGKGGTQAREWLRRSGYGEKVQLEGGDTPLMVNILGENTDSKSETKDPDSSSQG